jgi:anti-sigma regulatory factor (Ser/Thr protein kinase)
MLTYQVRERLDVYEPRRAIQSLAAKIGFRRNECHELAIVVSELASNIIKYGVRGTIALEDIWDQEYGPGVRIVAEDVGPPFHDLALAVQDGYDDRGPIDPVVLLKRGGLGTGLGAVTRLTDVFDVHPLAKGKQVCTVRYLRRPKVSAGRRRP